MIKHETRTTSWYAHPNKGEFFICRTIIESEGGFKSLKEAQARAEELNQEEEKCKN